MLLDVAKTPSITCGGCFRKPLRRGGESGSNSKHQSGGTDEQLK